MTYMFILKCVLKLVLKNVILYYINLIPFYFTQSVFSNCRSRMTMKSVVFFCFFWFSFRAHFMGHTTSNLVFFPFSSMNIIYFNLSVHSKLGGQTTSILGGPFSEATKIKIVVFLIPYPSVFLVSILKRLSFLMRNRFKTNPPSRRASGRRTTP